ncbi:MAG: copper ion binding protein [Aquihabitans sp.]
MSNTVATYSVSGMSCQHCVDAVTAEVGRLDGVEQVTVDLAAATVEVVSVAPLAQEKVREAVDEAGFDLVSMPTSTT